MHLVLNGAATAKERVENVGPFVFGNARAAIGDADLDRRPAGALHSSGENADPVIRFRSLLQRVIDEVLQGVPQS